jgi:DNA repair photolyase
MSELAINASNVVSPLCYSVLKIEPYTSCPHRCAYCYGRWYVKGPDVVAPRRAALAMFERVAKQVYRRGLRPMPFRLSTLVDPFPPHEELMRASEKVLDIARRYEHPLIVNTKSSRIVELEGLRRALEALLDYGLAVLQVSLSTLDDSKSKALEPVAPPPSMRLLMLRDFGSRGLPVVVRLSPYIPHYSPTAEEEVERVLGLFRDAGVKHLIVEALRAKREEAEELVKRLGLPKLELEAYSLREVEGGPPLVRISKELRVRAYERLYRHAVRAGMGFATCKEGLFRFHTTDDCCGAYLLRSYALRATLWDLHRTGVDSTEHGLDPSAYLDACRRFSRVCGEELRLYPRAISKPMRYHERRLLRCLEDRKLLERIAPDLLNRPTS